MKTHSIQIKVVAILVLIIANSCIDYYKISTKVNLDGSLERTIQIVADDSVSVFKGNLSVPIDSNWKISTRWFHEKPNDTSSGKKFEYTATRHFKNVDDLNDYLKIEKDSSAGIMIETEFQKKFRWFYTYLTYTETYKKSMPFTYSPVEDFMNETEIGYFTNDEYIYSKEHDSLIHIKDLEQIPVLSHSDSLRMEQLQENLSEKLSLFVLKNLVEEYVNLLMAELKTEAPEKYENILKHKDEIINAGTAENIFAEINSNSDPVKKIDSILGLEKDYFKIKNPTACKAFEDKTEVMINTMLLGDDIKNSISLPGILLNTNADSINNGMAFWNYNEKYFFANDYKLIAESRVINKWAFAVSALLILLLAFVLIRK